MHGLHEHQSDNNNEPWISESENYANDVAGDHDSRGLSHVEIEFLEGIAVLPLAQQAQPTLPLTKQAQPTQQGVCPQKRRIVAGYLLMTRKVTHRKRIQSRQKKSCQQ